MNLMPFFMPASTAETLIAGGTNIGDMSAGGGLAAAFDGTTSQASTAGARVVANNGYIGKTLAVPCAITRCEAWPSNNTGFDNSGGGSITLTLYGKQGSSPAGRTDGTTLGTVTFTDDTTTMRSITSSDQSTIWDHAWLGVVDAGAGGATNCAELKMYGLL
jgi:hypothetical protein